MIETLTMPRSQAAPAADAALREHEHALARARRRFTTAEYHRMAEAGVLTEDDRVELLDGEIVAMSPIGSRHSGTVNRLNMLFAQRLGSRAIVSVQNPIVLDDYSEPQPDLAILAARADYYVGAHPRPADVLLAIEVMETSGSYDRALKLPLYARRRLREVWLVDLAGGAVDVHRRPSPSGYRERQRLALGDRIAPLAFPRMKLQVGELLG